MLGTRSESNANGFSENMADLAPTLLLETEQGEHYLPPFHVQILEKLEHLSRYSNFIQIVLGPAGSGKTILSKQLFPNDEDTGVCACYLSITTNTGISEILEQLVEQLGIDLAPPSSNEAKLQAIYQHADLLQETSRQFLIIVDDGDRLNDDGLELLLKLLPSIRNPDARPHLVFFATPKLAEKLNTDYRFKETVESSCHFVELRSFNLEEIQGLLQHKYGSAINDLSQQQLETIHRESLGLPGRVPKAMDKLLSGAVEKVKTPPQGSSWNQFPKLHLLLFSAVASIAFIGWILVPDAQIEESSDRIRVNLPLPTSTQQVDQSAIAELDQSLEQRLKEAEAQLQAESQASIQQFSKTETSTANTNVITSKPETSPGSTPKPQTIQPELPSIKLQTDKKDRIAPETPQPIAAQTVKPQSNQSPKPVPDDKSNSNLKAAPVKESDSSSLAANQTSKQSAPASKKLVLQIPAKSAAVSPPSKPVSIKPPKTKLATKNQPASPYLREKELMSWDAKNYTLQMLGARKQQSVVQFIESQKNRDNFYYFSTIYKGKPWYVVVYGRYANRDKAIAAAKSLPADIRKNNPWARSVQGVQDDIRRKK
ncbi:AAA family ATPase [Motiliproteus sp. MSK22-1]|uniref:AAA family ATPase n=1 Tax=Motiliproteus sp. MSK22-1 TaxID=1897630 RepID=UPI0009766854|nr:AAA family ATPase [Motiliproteus sp. MSK22-1]OMH28049.1 hypothetical protein BGP75_22020 [Motiliproteus sp. MSK22-1]